MNKKFIIEVRIKRKYKKQIKNINIMIISKKNRR